MNQNRLITPEGTRDLLFEDCISRHLVESKIKMCWYRAVLPR